MKILNYKIHKSLYMEAKRQKQEEGNPKFQIFI